MVLKTNGLPTFAMNAEQARAYSELMDDMEEQGANCLDQLPSPWQDYGDDDSAFPEPSAVEAVVMCSGCPVVEGCFEYAKIGKQNHGVWGGIKFRKRMGRTS